jgi:hypothetical protein
VKCNHGQVPGGRKIPRFCPAISRFGQVVFQRLGIHNQSEVTADLAFENCINVRSKLLGVASIVGDLFLKTRFGTIRQALRKYHIPAAAIDLLRKPGSTETVGESVMRPPLSTSSRN